jgi:hypothetical protein
MYYTAKVRLVHEINTPKGLKLKKLTETYLVKAVSVTDAEAKVTESFQNESIDFEVTAVNTSKIVKIIQ